MSDRHEPTDEEIQLAAVAALVAGASHPRRGGGMSYLTDRLRGSYPVGAHPLVHEAADALDAAEAKLAAIGPMCRDVLIDLDFAHSTASVVRDWRVADLAASMAAVCRILDGEDDR